MAVAKTRTLLPLDVFARIAGIMPVHFNQVQVPVAPDSNANTGCGDTILQYSWQLADKVGREEIAMAISDAEAMIAQELGYLLRPDWTVAEPQSFPHGPRPELIALGMRNIRGFPNTLETNNGYAITGGIEAFTEIAALSPIVYTDPDGDGYGETATVTQATTVTDPEEIAIYYPGHGGEFEWEIRPIVVSIAAGVATIVFRREQTVLEILLEEMDAGTVDGLVDANFLDEVAVYRHYNDPSQQVTFEWENIGCLDCSGGGCASCGFSVNTGCMHVRDSRRGIVAVSYGTWDAATASFTTYLSSTCRAPDAAKLYYKSGWRNSRLSRPNITMDDVWARAVTYLALSLLDRPLCGCDSVQNFVTHWAENMAESKSTQGATSSISIGRQVDCPLGTTRAALYAWQLIQRNKIGKAA